MGQQISANVDGGLSGGSSVLRPGSEDPHRRQCKFSDVLEELDDGGCLSDYDMNEVSHLSS